MRKRNVLLFSLAIGLCTTSISQAQLKVETVVDGLYNPCGLAIQPETGHVFIADSGNCRVLRVVDGKAEEVIINFPKDIYGTGPKYDIGPLGLLFLDQETLVVGGGGLIDGEDLLRVYKIPAAGNPAIDAKEMVTSMLLAPTDEIKGEGNFYAMVATNNAIYVTCNGDDTKGWIAKADVDGTKVGPFKRFLATKEETGVDAPVGITVSPRGEVVVGQMGEITIPEDGLLTFYEADSGKMLANFEVGISDITGVAYSPKNQLYATDFAWHDTTQGGLFQLIATNGEQPGAEAKRLADLDKPTALVFGNDGSLYITVIGTGEGTGDGSTRGAGKLLRIAPGL